MVYALLWWLTQVVKCKSVVESKSLLLLEHNMFSDSGFPKDGFFSVLFLGEWEPITASFSFKKRKNFVGPTDKKFLLDVKYWERERDFNGLLLRIESVRSCVEWSFFAHKDSQLTKRTLEASSKIHTCSKLYNVFIDYKYKYLQWKKFIPTTTTKNYHWLFLLE